jgi:hypothetical protein
VVGFSDFVLLADNFGQGDIAAVPEPSVMVSMVLGLLGMQWILSRCQHDFVAMSGLPS